VVATNATLSKAQATRVAQMAHDGLARAVPGAHHRRRRHVVRAGDGGAGSEVNVIGAFAADMVAEAIVRAVRHATAAGGVRRGVICTTTNRGECIAMTRGLFLYLSTSAAMRSLVMGFPPARKAALRFVAGETVEQAVEVVRGLNARGILATLDCLGENVTTEEDAGRARDQYLTALERIAQSGVQSHVSLKLTQFGLDLGEEVCRANVARVIARAREIGAFVRIDMEGSDYTARTLSVLRALRGEYDNVGIVIQAYLYRSEADIRALMDEGTACACARARTRTGRQGLPAQGRHRRQHDQVDAVDAGARKPGA
jgi:hypothetical protein